MLSTPDRLALRREPDKSFTLLGLVTANTKSEVTVTTPGGVVERFPRGGIIFVAHGSLNHFARLDPEGLQRAFDGAPRAVFEQALVDAQSPLSAADLKGKLIQAGLAPASVDKAWEAVRQALEGSSDVKFTGERSARKFSWNGESRTRLRAYIAGTSAEPSDDRAPEEPTSANSVQGEPTPWSTPRAESLDPAAASGVSEPVEVPEVPAFPATGPREAKTLADGKQDQLEPQGILAAMLTRVLATAAPLSLDEIAGSVLRIGSALSSVPVKELRVLADVPEEQRALVSMLLVAREREVRLWPNVPETVDPAMAGAAIEAAIGEVSRSERDRRLLARFASRILQRTDLAAIPLPLVASAFVRSAGAESASELSQPLLDLAGALADRTKTSVGQEWDHTDAIIGEIARAVNRLPLDESGPRSRFLAALFEIRRKHLGNDLLWKNVDLDGLDLAAGGVMRRALLDDDVAERIIRPEVERYMAACSTRHGVARLIALRGSFARFIDAGAVTAVLERVARDDPKAGEWFRGLRQQDRMNAATLERDLAIQDAARARMLAEGAEKRTEKALAERDVARSALNRASQANVQASDAQLRQAKLDVLRSLASLAVTIKDSTAAKDDPALLQRLGFALRREGLVEIAVLGETVTYDPALHDAQGEHIDPGTSVSVGRSGYTYDSGDESLVLVKAHVSVI